MFGINRFKKGVISSLLQLRNLDGKVVEFNAGERVNLLALEAGSCQFFGIQNEAKGTVVLPPSLFGNNFLLFQKEI